MNSVSQHQINPKFIVVLFDMTVNMLQIPLQTYSPRHNKESELSSSHSKNKKARIKPRTASYQLSKVFGL